MSDKVASSTSRGTTAPVPVPVPTPVPAPAPAAAAVTAAVSARSPQLCGGQSAVGLKSSPSTLVKSRQTGRQAGRQTNGGAE